jgi:hypothetical protein
VVRNVGHPGDVPARLCEARHDSGHDRIADAHEDDGDRTRRRLGRQRPREAGRHDDVDPELDEFLRELVRPIGPPLRAAPGDADGLPVHVPVVVQSAQEVGLAAGRVRDAASSEKADPGDLPRRLSAGGERRHEDGEGEGDEKPDTAARHGNLLSPRTCGGILRAGVRGGKRNFADETGLLSEWHYVGS